MGGEIQVDNKIIEFSKSSKKTVDIIYLVSLFVFVSSYACKLVLSSLFSTEWTYLVSSAILTLIAIFRLFTEYFVNRKRALIIFAYLVFSLLIFIFSGNNLALNAAAIAVAGLGVRADYILATGIAGNLVMIINNIIISVTKRPGIYIVDNQAREYFLLGDNTFYVSKMNNFSSTDFAAHYFWIIAAYLWIRGKKLKWGEIAVLASLALLIYSLTASKTTLLCIMLLLFCAVIMKIVALYEKKQKKQDDQSNGKSAINGLFKVFEFCCKYSFLIFALIGIVLSVFYSNSSLFFLNLNNKLHWRLSLAHRGIIEYGIHLFTSDMVTYGMSSSIDGFYNFIDCSYLNLLLKNGIFMLVFYLLSMTAIQLKHKKYVFGAVILAICALSCFEEHHLSEIPYNMFILLLFSDFDKDYKKGDAVPKKRKTQKTGIPVISLFLCVDLIIASVALYYPKYKAVKELDRLDGRAGEIYSALQSNLDRLISDGSWKTNTSSMSSDQYGDLLDQPDDYSRIRGISWSEAVKDPKEHAYYTVSYGSGYLHEEDYPVLDLLISDDVKALIGSGSVIIEYDVVAGDVYSVWYSEMPGCYVIPDGRRTDRAGRLRTDMKVEGYSTGKTNG